MIVRISVDFDDDWRAAIAEYATHHHGDPRRKLATRQQCKDFVQQAIGNQNAAIADLQDDIATGLVKP